jgi:hypothetical protein
VPSARSVLRVLLAALGVVLVVVGLGILVPALGKEGFPVGLAIGLGILVIAAGGASLGAAALLSGHALKRSQRAALKLAGLLAVLAFVAPAMGMFVVPELLYDYFGLQAPAAAILGWLYLSLAALLIAVVVALWRAAELAYAAVASRYSA